MKKRTSILVALSLILGLFGAVPMQAAAAETKKSLIIGDTTFNAENWEETIDPHPSHL